MKKFLLIICLALGLSQTTNAQSQFGLKGGVNYNNNGDLTFYRAGSDVVNGAKAKSGFHVGMWFSRKIPIIGLYLRPEIVFTQVKSEYLYKVSNTSYDFKKIDVPILVGTKLFGVANVFIGPSFQYVLNSDFGLSSVSEVSLDKFSVGMQSGFGVEFGKFGIDVRWERGLSITEAVFVDNNTSVKIDNRTNQIIIGVSIRL